MANNKKFIVKNGLQTQNVGFVSPNAANTLEVALLDTDILQLDGNISVLGNVALTGTVDGRDVAADGTKLDGIASGAEVNQNAFSNIAVSGQTTVAADSKTDTLTLVAGTNVTITTDATTDSITINANDTSVDWSEIQNKPDPTVTVTLTGDVTGTANTTLTDLASGTISVATTIAANSVALGTDTTGNYVASVATTAPLSGGAAGSEGSTLTLSLASGYGDTQNPYASKTANTVLAAPNGSAGVPSFRTLVAQDIPSLDASKITSGVFDAARLPSYVDDVLEYTNLASFPATGETGKIYVDLATNKTYRWSGTVYVYITSGAVDSVAGKTGVVTLTNSDVGLGNVENKSSATIRSELTSTNVTTALGYTPYNSTNPNGYTTNTGTVTSVAAGSYLTGGTITTSGTLAVDATSANTASKVVARDASGNFSAGTITAALSGNASTATTLQTARTLTIGSTGKTFNGSANVSWSHSELETTRNFGYVTVQGVVGSNLTCTTAQFITWLTNLGAFSQTASVMKCAWGYAGNNDISDTGFGTLEMAGCVIETFGDTGSYIVRVTSPSTGTGAGGVHEYVNHGASYSPGWRRVYTSNLNGNITGSSSSCTGNAATATTATYLTTTQLNARVTGQTNSLAMTASDSTNLGSFVCRATGTGDANLAGITFHNDSYAIKLGVRADGAFGLGGWSRAAWSWYSDPSGNMVAAGNVTAYSDPRLKENFAKVENPLEILSKLDGGTFNWKRGYSHTECKAGSRDYGILADQVELVMPEIVTESIEIDGEKYKTVAYEKLIPVLIEAIKELKAEIDLLKSVK